MQPAPIPDIIVGRLPLYLRALSQMAAEGILVASSLELGARLGISSAQIRKDLSHFGEFGKQGTGYDVAFLEEQLRRILKVDRVWDVALVGVGDLGRAVVRHGEFLTRGFRITSIYDDDPAKIGDQVDELVIQDASTMVEDIRSRGIRVAMLTVPAQQAQRVATRLVEAGIQAILCYAPTAVIVPDGVQVQYIDPLVHLQRMTHHLP
jgi:redox-sensing transcriptional repressor